MMQRALKTQTTQAGLTASQNEKAASLINRLFKELKGCKPAWSAALKTKEFEDEAKRQYVKALVESNIRDWSVVEKGIAKARRHTGAFFPSTGEFVEWCLGEDEHFERARIRNSQKEWDRERALPKPMNREVGKKHIQELKAKLKG